MTINQKQLLEMLDVGRTTLWRMINRKEFPVPNRANPRKLIWNVQDIEDWFDQKYVGKGL